MSSPAPTFRNLGLRVLRSIDARTGALIGIAAPASYVLSAAVATVAIGRPSTDDAVGTVLALTLLCTVGAIVGTAIGAVVGTFVRSTAMAGPPDGRTIRRGLALAVFIAMLFGVQFVREAESRNRPRVFQSDRTVARVTGDAKLAPLTPAALVLDPSARRTATAIVWRGLPLDVKLNGSTLLVSQSSGLVDDVRLEGLDYVSEVIASTASLDGKREWLALLVRLRSGGRRELLLIYDPAGVRVHHELLARTASAPNPVLWSAGPTGELQEFKLDLGEPLRYVAAK